MQHRDPATRNRPRLDPLRREWSQRTGPSTWLVWQHGTRPSDDDRLADEAAKELAREQPGSTTF
jgi:hypothetical protein